MKQPILSTILLAILSATASTSAAQNKQPDDVRAMAKKVMMPVVLKVPGMDKVKVVENLKYTKSDDPNVLMDIYIPPDLSENEKRPAVIFLHGGAKTDYTPKDWGVYTSWGRLIAASGFVAVTFTHRLEYPMHPWKRRPQTSSMLLNICARMPTNTTSIKIAFA